MPTEIGKGFLWFSKNFYGFSYGQQTPFSVGSPFEIPESATNLRMDAAKAALQGEFAATSFQSLRLKMIETESLWEMPGVVDTVDGSESQGQPPVRM